MASLQSDKTTSPAPASNTVPYINSPGSVGTAAGFVGVCSQSLGAQHGNADGPLASSFPAYSSPRSSTQHPSPLNMSYSTHQQSYNISFEPNDLSSSASDNEISTQSLIAPHSDLTITQGNPHEYDSRFYESFIHSDQITTLYNNNIDNNNIFKTNNTINMGNSNSCTSLLSENKLNSVSNESLNLITGTDQTVMQPHVPHIPPISPLHNPSFTTLTPIQSNSQNTTSEPLENYTTHNIRSQQNQQIPQHQRCQLQQQVEADQNLPNILNKAYWWSSEHHYDNASPISELPLQGIMLFGC